MRHCLRVIATSLILSASHSVFLQAQVSSTVEVQNSASPKGKSATASGGPVALPDDFSKLRLEPSYSMQFDVFGVPEFSQQLTVDDAGDVVVPMVGPLHVAGDTMREAELKIQRLLIEKMLINAPTVTLKIVEFAKPSVTVGGEVQSPGKVQLLAPRSLVNVLSLVGGETAFAGAQVEIRHVDANGIVQLQLVPYIVGKDSTAAQAALVYPGDSVYVQKAGIIYVLGAVNRSGGYLMTNGGSLTVPQALATAGGASPVASTKEAIIVRLHDGQITRLTVPLKKEETGEAATVTLMDGDMLYVPTSKVKAALVNSSSILTSAASAGIVTAFNR